MQRLAAQLRQAGTGEAQTRPRHAEPGARLLSLLLAAWSSGGSLQRRLAWPGCPTPPPPPPPPTHALMDTPTSPAGLINNPLPGPMRRPVPCLPRRLMQVEDALRAVPPRSRLILAGDCNMRNAENESGAALARGWPCCDAGCCGGGQALQMVQRVHRTCRLCSSPLSCLPVMFLGPDPLLPTEWPLPEPSYLPLCAPPPTPAPPSGPSLPLCPGCSRGAGPGRRLPAAGQAPGRKLQLEHPGQHLLW